VTKIPKFWRKVICTEHETTEVIINETLSSAGNTRRQVVHRHIHKVLVLECGHKDRIMTSKKLPKRKNCISCLSDWLFERQE